MSTKQANDYLKKFTVSDCKVKFITRHSGKWTVFLNQKPDQIVKDFLNELFYNVKLEVVE